MGLFGRKEKNSSAMFDEASIVDMNDHKEMQIPSQWAQFLTLKNEMTTKAYALSEFIDNSLSSHLKTFNRENEFSNLRINIRIFQKKNNETGKIEQSIEIEDNAGGMSESQLFQSITMNDTDNKSSSDLNQYGYGMKLGIFWLGQGFQINTKSIDEQKEHYTHHLIDSVEKANEIATVKVYPCENENMKIKGTSGTIVRVLKIHEWNLFEQNEIEDDLKMKIASRYSECIKNGLTITISFEDLDNKDDLRNVRLKEEDGKICPYSLKDVLEYYSSNEGMDFKKELYLGNLKGKLDSESENDLNKFTSGVSFKDKLLSQSPLLFSFKKVFNGKETTVNWGIMAMNECKKNTFAYKALSGFKLIHNCRAIIHGPNETSAKQMNKNLNMKAFSIPTENSGGNTSWVRIFGDIDLTGIEQPERNKRSFIWSAYGDMAISKVLGDLWKAIRPFANILIDMEKDASIVKTINMQGRSKNWAIKNVEKIFTGKKISLTNFDSEDKAVSFEIKDMKIFGDDNPVTFKILPLGGSDEYKALDIVKKNESTVEITINLQHTLFSYYCSSGKSNNGFIYCYCLAISLAICKFRYDNLLNDGYSEIRDKTPFSFNFEEVFNNVWKELCDK